MAKRDQATLPGAGGPIRQREWTKLDGGVLAHEDLHSKACFTNLALVRFPGGSSPTTLLLGFCYRKMDTSGQNGMQTRRPSNYPRPPCLE